MWVCGDRAFWWSWVFIGRTDVEAETPILLPPHAKSWLIGKDPDAGRDWGQEEKGTTEDEIAGWHHRLDGHEFEWAPGVGDGQGGLACCNSWGRKESDTTEQLNWTELKVKWGLMGVPDPVWLVFLWEEIRTQIYTEERPGEDGCPKAREWGLGRNQPCPHPDFGLPASRTVRK